MKDCNICEGKQRVELVCDEPGRSMWMDCPACRPVPSWATIAQLRAELKQARLAAILFAVGILVTAFIALARGGA